EHQTSRPQDFGLHNVRGPWCDPGLPSSLLCHASTPDSAVGADPANLDAWLFADTIHPTPAGHQALADRAVAELIAQGWVDAPAVR
ncbi:MAG: esterase, partial [Betaproteobacteria bacterium]|nr:esterase [Betaproteobacteria bacterium]